MQEEAVADYSPFATEAKIAEDRDDDDKVYIEAMKISSGSKRRKREREEEEEEEDEEEEKKQKEILHDVDENEVIQYLHGVGAKSETDEVVDIEKEYMKDIRIAATSLLHLGRKNVFVPESARFMCETTSLSRKWSRLGKFYDHTKPVPFEAMAQYTDLSSLVTDVQATYLKRQDLKNPSHIIDPSGTRVHNWFKNFTFISFLQYHEGIPLIYCTSTIGPREGGDPFYGVMITEPFDYSMRDIKNNPELNKLSLVRLLIPQIVNIMHRLQRSGVCHYGINHYSVVCSKKMKIGIFGWENATIDKKTHKARCNLLPFVAPEVLDPAGSCLTEKTDCWTVGMLILYLLQDRGKFILGSLNRKDYNQKLASYYEGNLDSFESFEKLIMKNSVASLSLEEARCYYDIVSSLTKYNPAERSSLGECMARLGFQPLPFPVLRSCDLNIYRFVKLCVEGDPEKLRHAVRRRYHHDPLVFPINAFLRGYHNFVLIQKE